MKLSQINYDLNKPTEIEILDPQTNKSFEKPAFISIYSIESQKGKTAQLSIIRAMMNMREENKDKDINEDDAKEVTIKPIASLIAGWRGLEDEDGKEIKYNEDNAEMLLRDYDIIYNTVYMNSNMMGNFKKK
jgi:hypothetical protein